MKFPISKQLFEQVEVRRLRMKILSLVLIVYLVFEVRKNFSSSLFLPSNEILDKEFIHSSQQMGIQKLVPHCVT